MPVKNSHTHTHTRHILRVFHLRPSTQLCNSYLISFYFRVYEQPARAGISFTVGQKNMKSSATLSLFIVQKEKTGFIHFVGFVLLCTIPLFVGRVCADKRIGSEANNARKKVWHKGR